MLNPKQMNVFKRDLKAAQKRGRNMEKLKAAVQDLLNEVPLAPSLKDHPLLGNHKGDRECHLEPDWLLIYTIIDQDLILVRTGTHADLFR